MTLHNAPPSHWQTLTLALILDAVVVYGIVWTWLLIRATSRPVCTCERAAELERRAAA
jgi:hypothetical protein